MKVLLFSVDDELFASPLSALCESVDEPLVHAMPGAGHHAIGVLDLRGRRIPAFSPETPLNVAIEGKPGAALVIGDDAAFIALLVSDVNDVLEVDPSEIRIAPGSDDADGILLGVFQHEGKLVSLVDPDAIRDACLATGARR
jgi:chemotaxis signal transduction protein